MHDMEASFVASNPTMIGVDWSFMSEVSREIAVKEDGAPSGGAEEGEVTRATRAFEDVVVFDKPKTCVDQAGCHSRPTIVIFLLLFLFFSLFFFFFFFFFVWARGWPNCSFQLALLLKFLNIFQCLSIYSTKYLMHTHIIFYFTFVNGPTRSRDLLVFWSA